MQLRTRFLLASIALGAGQLCTSSAHAQSPLRPPASLLVFPISDTTPGHDTLFTVTNTNHDHTILPGGLAAGRINVEFVHLSETSCLEFNRTERLEPDDTFTGLMSTYVPTMDRGYVYVFAKSPSTGQAVSFNWLTGTSTQLDGLFGDYTIEPFTYRAIGAEGALTDLDGDGRRDLDGIEYEPVADEILIPRFHGQSATTQSELVLINLTGARQFQAVANILMHNDNEEAFSAQFSFRCWSKVPLSSVSAAFTNAFLQSSTNHDLNEPIGAPGIENGWFRIDGAFAASTVCTVPDPAILACLIEGRGTSRFASLPFASSATQTNGSLTETGQSIDGCAPVVDGGKAARPAALSPTQKHVP